MTDQQYTTEEVERKLKEVCINDFFPNSFVALEDNIFEQQPVACETFKDRYQSERHSHKIEDEFSGLTLQQLLERYTFIHNLFEKIDAIPQKVAEVMKQRCNKLAGDEDAIEDALEPIKAELRAWHRQDIDKEMPFEEMLKKLEGRLADFREPTGEDIHPSH